MCLFQPIFGLIKSKLDLVTSAFVASGDLTQTEQLVEAFHNINMQLRGVGMATSEEHLHGVPLPPAFAPTPDSLLYSRGCLLRCFGFRGQLL